MNRWAVATIGLACVLGTAASGLETETIKVPRTDMTYPTRVVRMIDEQPVPMRCTGVGVRERTLLKINAYAIASYIDEKAPVPSAEELASANILKMLHLKVERDFKAKTIVDAFIKGIRDNYPEPKFAVELSGFRNYFVSAKEVKENTEVWLTHVPGKGLVCSIAGENELQIQNPEFSTAIWNIWLGPKHASANVKTGLVSLL